MNPLKDNRYIFEGNIEMNRQRINKMLNKNKAADSFKILDKLEQIPNSKHKK